MIAVVSQCWTSDEDAAAEAYVAGSADFLEFLRGQPGFRGRVLLRSLDDPTEFTNVRFFDSVEDYERMIHVPGYAPRIEDLGRHLRLEAPPTKTYVEVVLDDRDAGS